MTSNRPYFIRALHEWICDNNMTPYIVINATDNNVNVPKRFVENGKIILNISPAAAHALQINNDYIEFMARFSGAAMHIYAPIKAVVAIYASENGRGMVFNEDEDDGGGGGGNGNEGGGPTTPTTTTKKGKPQLRVVK